MLCYSQGLLKYAFLWSPRTDIPASWNKFRIYLFPSQLFVVCYLGLFVDVQKSTFFPPRLCFVVPLWISGLKNTNIHYSPFISLILHTVYTRTRHCMCPEYENVIALYHLFGYNSVSLKLCGITVRVELVLLRNLLFIIKTLPGSVPVILN